MARGRHRHAPLHRLLIPAAAGGLAVLCALIAWLVGDLGDGTQLALRLLITLVAAAAVTVALLIRRWDLDAGRKVARERAAKAGISWQVEERKAELEEAQELVSALEEKIRDKRGELGRMRTEHADLLRRYAHAESERVKALEGRRQLELEASEPTKALTAHAADHRNAAGAPTRLTYLQAYEALGRLSRNVARQRAAEERKREAESREPYVSSGVPPRRPDGSPAQQHGQGRGRIGGFDFFGTGGDGPASGHGPDSRAGAAGRPAANGSPRR